MAILQEDSSIVFASLEEFAEHFSSHISKGGFFLDTQYEWPPRTPGKFTLRVGGTPISIPIVAEIVYCAGGKVGLEIAPGSEGMQAMEALLKEVGNPPTLNEKKLITYPLATTFLDQYEDAATPGLLSVKSPTTWPQDKPIVFILRIEEHDLSLAIRAQVVVQDGDRVQLQVEDRGEIKEAVDDLVAALKSLTADASAPEPAKPAQVPAREPAREPEQQSAREPLLAPEPSVPPPVPAGDRLRPFEGAAVATRDEEELSWAQPFAHDSGEPIITTLFSLLATAASLEQAVRLTLEAGDVRMQLELNPEGYLVRYVGPDSDAEFLDRLGERFAVEEELLAKLKADTGPDRPADLLVQTRGYSPEQVRSVLRGQVIDALERLRTAGQANFRAEPIETDRTDGVRFGFLIIPWMEEALRSLGPDRVKKLIKPMWAAVPRRNQDAPWGVNFLDLSDIEYEFTCSLDGEAPLQERIKEAPKAHRNRLMRLAITLRAIGTVLVPGLDEPAVPKLAEAEEPDPGVDLARDLDALRRSDNRFEWLGVHWSTHPREFAAALRELDSGFGPTSDLARSSPEAAGLCEQRVALARQAFKELGDPELRQHHRQTLVPSSNLLVSAKMMFEKALNLIKEEKLEESVDYLEMAIEFDPMPAYRKRLEWVRNQLAWDGEGGD